MRAGVMPEIEELTTDLDRRSGQRRLRLTEGYERADITIQHESNEPLGDDTDFWRAVDHPPVNDRLAGLLLDVVCALRARRFGTSLGTTPPAKLPAADDA
jgi:hypothetical protein